MNKQPSRIGLYLVLIIALVAGYFYLNNQVVSQSNYTQKQLEQALEDNKVVDATIQQNREDRKSTRLNSSHIQKSRMPSSA